MAKRILWVFDHRTAYLEEVSILLQAGFEVIPTIGDDSGLNWRAKTTLGPVADKIRSLGFSHKHHKTFIVDKETIDLINDNIDIIFLNGVLGPAVHLLAWFNGKIVFRAYGHGDLNTYTQILEYSKIDIKIFDDERFLWCPIASSLNTVESKDLIKRSLVIHNSINPKKDVVWSSKESELKVCNTISYLDSKNGKGTYYRRVYKKFIQDYKGLPLTVLGKNKKTNEVLAGYLDDCSYYDVLKRSRIMLYHGNNPRHLHYHPLEALAIGLPVLIHEKSMLGYLLREIGVKCSHAIGVYHNPSDAKKLAFKCLDDVDIAIEISKNQKIFAKEIFNKNKIIKKFQRLNK